MRRKIFIAFMIVFTVLVSCTLFVSLLCGVPVDSEDVGRYIFGAAGMSVFLPAGFSFFLVYALDLSRELKRREEAVEEEQDSKKESAASVTSDMDVQIPALVNALAEKRKLTPEEKEKLLSYLEEL